MFDFQSELDESSLLATVDSLSKSLVGRSHDLLERVGAEVTAELRQLSPSDRGWRNVTGNLADSYAFEVHTHSDGPTLVLSNSAEYAATLQARDGYFVLTGVLDAGGPVEGALLRGAASVAPDWEVRYG